MRVVIDRFEGPYAVCEKEDRTMVDIKRILLPKGAKEGSVLNINNDEIVIDEDETKRREKNIEALTKDIWA